MADPSKPLFDDDATIADGVTAVGSPSSSGSDSGTEIPTLASRTRGTGPALEPGTVLAGRYEILQQLGEGGMGAVYKARDRELDRVVALKTIRPEMASSAAMLSRFKQEVLLASQVTHRNVVRLYDLGEANGLKFITMEFVEGEDLRALLQNGKLPPEDAVSIIRQTCKALEAAHEQGVIHRDLKPQNIMRDRSGRIVVMDFGLARTLETGGMTQTGALVGTMEYMSPEQALGEEIDARSDLFAVGLIFYELLTGKVPYKAETAIASLLKRAQEPARPVSDIDNSVPRSLSNIVAKCLERDRKLRYQSAQEILQDLEKWQGPETARSIVAPVLKKCRSRRVWITVAVVAIALVGSRIAYWQGLFPTGAKQTQVAAAPTLSVAILPFRNASGNPQFDWMGQSVADMLGTDIGQSAQVRTVSPERIHDILNDLHIGPDSSLDPDLLGRVASFTSADVVVSGQFVVLGDHVRVDASVRDLKHGRTVPLKVETSEKDLLSGVDTLAKSVRENLAVSPEVAKEMAANAFKPESKSLAALRAYNEGIDLARHGNNAEAVKKFQEATNQDGGFAMAYSKMAQAYAALGYDNDAENASRRATQIEESSPSPQRYLIQATHYRILHDTNKAIDAYEKLAATFPENDDVQLALAKLYEDTRASDKASEHYQTVLKGDPKNTNALIGMGRVALLKGDAQGSIDYLNRALALAVQVDNEDQKASTLFLLGTAYGMLNKPNDALRSFQESLDIRKRRDDKGGSAQILNSMAQVQEDLGQYAAAQKNYEDALRLRREIGDKRGIGNTLLDLGSLYESRGKYDEALDFSKQSLQIQRELNDPLNQASCLNNIGWIYLDKGDYENATTYFQQALQLREKLNDPAAIAETVYNLADTASRMGQYDQAITYFLRASELWRKAGDNKGLATAAYGMGRLFEYQGRYGAAVNSEQDALKNYQTLKERGVLLAQIQGGYGNALTLVGRDAEARKNLDEALAQARESKNDALVSQLLNYEGDSFFYTGDYNAAANSYKLALNTATRAKDREKVLWSKFNLAKVAVQQGRGRDVVKALKQLADDADRAGLKYLSVECSTYAAAAMIGTKEYSGAREQLERNLSASEKLNLKGLLAQNQYLLALALQNSGNKEEAARHFDEARRLADEIRKEAGDGVMRRSDLKEIYAEQR